MRCQFCGWDNPENSKKCEKCGKALDADAVAVDNASPEGGAVAEENHSRPTNRRGGESFSPKATIREGGNIGASSICPKCGYMLEGGKCASCGYDANAGKIQEGVSAAPERGGFAHSTVRPVRKKIKQSFRLTPLSEKDGTPEGDPIVFKGEDVTLNRANLAHDNVTITSREQAQITLADNHWLIEDKSEQRTTFVQAARRVELRAGDILLIGDQLFLFEV